MSALDELQARSLFERVIKLERKQAKKQLMINIPLLVWCLFWYWHGWTTDNTLLGLVITVIIQGGIAIWAGLFIGRAITVLRQPKSMLGRPPVYHEVEA